MVKATSVPGKEDDRRREPEATEQETGSLKGTFASVMLLGAFIALSWLAVFLLFVYRNA